MVYLIVMLRTMNVTSVSQSRAAALPNHVRLIAITHTCTDSQRSRASNIKPVRGFLRNTNARSTTSSSKSWIFLGRRGGKGSTSRVACSPPETVRSAATTRKPGSFDTHSNQGRLAIIMGFLPLKEAFGEYCQRALCSEVYKRCVDVCTNLKCCKRSHVRLARLVVHA